MSKNSYELVLRLHEAKDRVDERCVKSADVMTDEEIKNMRVFILRGDYESASILFKRFCNYKIDIKPYPTCDRCGVMDKYGSYQHTSSEYAGTYCTQCSLEIYRHKVSLDWAKKKKEMRDMEW